MNIRTFISHARDGLLSVGYPSSCRLCKEPIESWDDGIACSKCWTDPDLTWTFEHTPVCYRCGEPLGVSSKLSAASPMDLDTPPVRVRFCGLCSGSILASSRSCGDYSGAIQANILLMKTAPFLCPRLRRVMAESLEDYRESLRCDVIAPVPLHPARLRERGFNQASLIAKAVSKALGIPISEGLLARTKLTGRHRAGMDPVDRAKSVERAFGVATSSQVHGRSVLLVDDVYTTGATVKEAAEALLTAGASAVRSFTIARVVLTHDGRAARHSSHRPGGYS